MGPIPTARRRRGRIAPASHADLDRMPTTDPTVRAASRFSPLKRARKSSVASIADLVKSSALLRHYTMRKHGCILALPAGRAITVGA